MMIKQNLKLLNDVLSIIIKKMPKIIEFENKRAFFKHELKRFKGPSYHYPQISLKFLFKI